MNRATRQPTNEGPIVLVADQQRETAQRLVRRLVQHGFRSAHTASGEEVLVLARAGRLRLAVVDAALADMSGHALAARLRRLDPRLPILMTSADHRPELEIQARRLGVLYYAHKPITSERVEAVVSRALGRGQRSAPGTHEPTRAKGRGRE